MYAITGITGNVGGAVARTLLAAGQPVRAVVRDAAKGAAWKALGCDIAVAEMEDADALAAAFAGTTAVFVLPPPNFDPLPGFPKARAANEAARVAIERARPQRVVCLSTVGAQATPSNLLSQRTLIEEALRTGICPVTFLRPAWFLENTQWDIAQARADGVVSSFLQPLDRRIPMVATADVGRVAAELLMQPASGHRVVELEGPQRVSPQDIAETLSVLLGRPVQAQVVPRETWEALFRAQGMRDPRPRIRMLDGFNEGWIRFEGADDTIVRGVVGLAEVLAPLVATR